MTPSSPHPTADVLVVGGGPIGLAIAWRLAQGGRAVGLVDPDPGSGASRAAGGMLAPVTEAHYGEENLLRLNLASAALYPRFVAELEAASGQPTGYRPCGTLTVSFDAGDRSALDDIIAYHQSLGLEATRLTPRQARELEPVLAPGVFGGALVPGDHRIDPRALTAALCVACRRAGVAFHAQSGKRVLTSDQSVRGVALGDGTVLEASTVVVAAGCGSPALVADIRALELPVRPIKGQVVILRRPGGTRLPNPLLRHNLRAMVEGRHVYLVPRDDGRILLGATAEEKGFDLGVTVEAVHDLLRGARLVLPAAAELEIVETLAGLRPASPDNAPIIGTTRIEGLVAATGHYRNGILLTPVTAATVAELVLTGNAPEAIAPFSPIPLERVSASRP